MSNMISVTFSSNTTRTTDIVPADTTIRAALESHGIDYTAGMTSIDGATLRAGEIDQTFEELGIGDRCYLMTVVKADNAATIKVFGRNAIVESAATLGQIRTLAKYRPDALALFEGEGADRHPVFRVAPGIAGTGDIGKFGVIFGVNPNAAGKATVSLTMPDEVTDPVEYIAEEVGAAILSLNKVEAQFAPAAADLESELAAIRANIEIVG